MSDAAQLLHGCEAPMAEGSVGTVSTEDPTDSGNSKQHLHFSTVNWLIRNVSAKRAGVAV
jgi:hypothetical protein